ncbi:hypothetical protein [Paracidovorax citrulli]
MTLRQKLKWIIHALLNFLRRPWRRRRQTPCTAIAASRAPLPDATRFPSPDAVAAGRKAAEQGPGAAAARFNAQAAEPETSSVVASAPREDTEVEKAVREACQAPFDLSTARCLAMEYLDAALDPNSRGLLQDWVRHGVQRLALEQLRRVGHPACGNFWTRLDRDVQIAANLTDPAPAPVASLHWAVRESLVTLSRTLPLLRSAICCDVELRQAVVIVMRWLSATPGLELLDQCELRHLAGTLCRMADNLVLTSEGEFPVATAAPAPRRVWGAARG